MAYRDFTLRKLKEKFGIQNKLMPLFDTVPIQPMLPSDWLTKTLSLTRKLALRSEKSKSEAIVMPVLVELKERNQDFFMIHSGEMLNVDKELGINGECDFLLSANPKSYIIDTPIISLVEAKKGELDLGMGQCAAQMYAAKLQNEIDDKPLDVIYGCVTNSDLWQFMKLENNQLTIDEKKYSIEKLEAILGIFQHIIDYYKSILEPMEARCFLILKLRIMAYRDFKLKDLDKKFGVSSQIVELFQIENITKISPGEWLNGSLERAQLLQLITEKAKSEAIVMPILLELKYRNNDFFTIFSGGTLNVDKERGLNGECDFILSAKPKVPYIDTPIISIVEAKKGELDLGMGQCAAQMYAAKLQNEDDDKPLDVIYGCVTNGREWQFMKLENNQLFIDKKIYPIGQLDTILGIFQHIIDYYKSILEPVEAT